MFYFYLYFLPRNCYVRKVKVVAEVVGVCGVACDTCGGGGDVMAALVVVLVVVQFHRSCEENIIPSLVAVDALLLKDFTELLTNRPLNLGFSLKMRLSPFVDSRSIKDSP